MITYKEWRLGGNDPEWDKLKYEWGGNSKNVDPSLINKMKLKIEGIKDNFAKEFGDPKIQSFRDVPPGMRDELAKALVVATMKAFYADLGSNSINPKDAGPTPKKTTTPNTQTGEPEPQAPAGWKGQA